LVPLFCLRSIKEIRLYIICSE